jgi:hypothetical protein
MTYEIYWDDLTPEAQARLIEIWHENLDTQPLVVFDTEEEDDDDDEDYYPPFESTTDIISDDNPWPTESKSEPDIDEGEIVDV